MDLPKILLTGLVFLVFLEFLDIWKAGNGKKGKNKTCKNPTLPASVSEKKGVWQKLMAWELYWNTNEETTLGIRSLADMLCNLWHKCLNLPIAAKKLCLVREALECHPWRLEPLWKFDWTAIEKLGQCWWKKFICHFAPFFAIELWRFDRKLPFFIRLFQKVFPKTRQKVHLSNCLLFFCAGEELLPEPFAFSVSSVLCGALCRYLRLLVWAMQTNQNDTFKWRAINPFDMLCQTVGWPAPTVMACSDAARRSVFTSCGLRSESMVHVQGMTLKSFVLWLGQISTALLGIIIRKILSHLPQFDTVMVSLTNKHLLSYTALGEKTSLLVSLLRCKIFFNPSTSKIVPQYRKMLFVQLLAMLVRPWYPGQTNLFYALAWPHPFLRRLLYAWLCHIFVNLKLSRSTSQTNIFGAIQLSVKSTSVLVYLLKIFLCCFFHFSCVHSTEKCQLPSS